MGTNKIAGFTIIETVLFLGISGLLVVALLIGVGASLNTQRYRDATESFKSLLQQQYSELTSVQNARDDTWSCGSDAAPITGGPISDNRGQSDCMLVGKYVRVDSDKISVYTLTGYQTDPAVPTNDIIGLKTHYVFNISKTEADTSTLEWGTRVSYPVIQDGVVNPDPTSRKIGILIVRSPDSGQIYTFTNSDSDVPDDANLKPASFESMIVEGGTVPGQGSRLICIDSNGMFTANDRGVYINSFASGASAVEMRSNEFMRSIGQAMTC